MKDDFMESLLQAHERSLQRAFDVAARTNTSLIFSKDNKIVEVKPNYRYERVQIEPTKKITKKK